MLSCGCGCGSLVVRWWTYVVIYPGDGECTVYI